MFEYKKLQEFAHSDKEDGREFIQALYEYSENLTPIKIRKLLELIDDECDCHDAMIAITHIFQKLTPDKHIKSILKWMKSDSYKYSNYLEISFYILLNGENHYNKLKKYTEIFPSENLKRIYLNIKAYAENAKEKEKIDYEHIEKCNELLKILDESI